MKMFVIFLIFAQNIDCGYTYVRTGGEINVYPCKPQFYYIKVGCKGVYITRTCLHDVKACPEVVSWNDILTMTCIRDD